MRERPVLSPSYLRFVKRERGISFERGPSFLVAVERDLRRASGTSRIRTRARYRKVRTGEKKTLGSGNNGYALPRDRTVTIGTATVCCPGSRSKEVVSYYPIRATTVTALIRIVLPWTTRVEAATAGSNSVAKLRAVSRGITRSRERRK